MQYSCWFCGAINDAMEFCTEFDTYVHYNCAAIAAEDENNKEAQIIFNEIKRQYGIQESEPYPVFEGDGI